MAVVKRKRGRGDRGRRGSVEGDCAVVSVGFAGWVGWGMAMEISDARARKAAVAKKKSWMPPAEEREDRRTSTGQAMAPRPHATLSRAMRRARAPGTVMPAMTLPAVRPAPRPRPIEKSARCAWPKP